MKLLAALVCACAACVPASEPAPPAGAIGFLTEPTPASLGEAFATTDGWTVRVELLAFQINVSASTGGGAFGDGYSYGSSAPYRLRSSDRVEVFASGLDVGIATARVSLRGNYIDPSRRGDDDERVEDTGLPADVRARFGRPAEAVGPSTYARYSGPALLLVARAERAGRVVRVDFTMPELSFESDPFSVGEVRADSLTIARLVVDAAVLFRDTSTGELGQLVFDDFAAADADGNGTVDGAEVGATAATNTGRGSLAGSAGGLLDHLALRSARLLTIP